MDTSGRISLEMVRAGGGLCAAIAGFRAPLSFAEGLPRSRGEEGSDSPRSGSCGPCCWRPPDVRLRVVEPILPRLCRPGGFGPFSWEGGRLFCSWPAVGLHRICSRLRKRTRPPRPRWRPRRLGRTPRKKGGRNLRGLPRASPCQRAWSMCRAEARKSAFP